MKLKTKKLVEQVVETEHEIPIPYYFGQSGYYLGKMISEDCYILFSEVNEARASPCDDYKSIAAIHVRRKGTTNFPYQLSIDDLMSYTDKQDDLKAEFEDKFSSFLKEANISMLTPEDYE